MRCVEVVQICVGSSYCQLGGGWLTREETQHSLLGEHGISMRDRHLIAVPQDVVISVFLM